MKWFEIELEIPIYGKSFEIVQAFDSETAIQIAIKKTVNQYNILSQSVSIIFVKEIPKGSTGKIQRIGLAKKLGLKK